MPFPATANPNALNGLQITRIADNASPTPNTRIFFTFNYFSDVDRDGLGDIVAGVPSLDSFFVFGRETYGTRPSEIFLNAFSAPQNPADPTLQDFFGYRGFGNAGFGNGISVAVGDVNGDGLPDIISGTEQGGSSQQGITYVLFGTNSVPTGDVALSGLNGSNGFRIEGAGFNFQSGISVAVGDVNGDGFADVVSGAPGANSGAGRASLVFGGAGPFNSTIGTGSLNGSNGFNLTGFGAGEAAGLNVLAQRLNDDEFADIVVARRFADPNGRVDAGAVSVLFGTQGPFVPTIDVNSLNGTNGLTIIGAVPGQQLGWSLAGGGDVNGDGRQDVLIGAPPTNNFAGGAALVFGPAGPVDPILDIANLNGTNGFFINGIDPNDSTGFSVAFSDVNGDGFDDMVIGAPDTDPNGVVDAGTVFVVFGSASGFAPTIDLNSIDGTNGFRFNGATQFGRTGIATGTADFDGDGILDIVVGNEGPGDSTIIYGMAPEVAVTRNGSAAGQRIHGSPLADFLNGIGGDDTLFGGASGDLMDGGDGNDAGILDIQADQFIGGPGTDTAVVLGTGAGIRNTPFTLNISSTEVALIPTVTDPRFGVPPAGFSPYNFSLIIPDTSVIAGNRLDVQATGLQIDEGLSVDASLVSGGGVWVYAGAGANNHVGGAGSDAVLFGSPASFLQNNTFNGNDNVDSLGFRGNFVGQDAVVFQNNSFSNVEVVVALTGLANPFGGPIVAGGFDYDFTLLDGNVGSGQGLDIVGTSLGASESLTFDGSAVLDGFLRFFGGNGDDTFIGGNGDDLMFGNLGADVMNGGPGANVFVYRNILDSTPTSVDRLTVNGAGGDDSINLDFLDADTTQDGNQNFIRIENAPFTAPGQLRWFEVSSGLWCVQGDVNGDQIPDLQFDVFTATLTAGIFVG